MDPTDSQPSPDDITTFILAMLTVPGVGYVTVNRAIDAIQRRQDTYCEFLGRGQSELVRLLPGLDAQTVSALCRCDGVACRQSDDLLRRIQDRGIGMVTRESASYPETLEQAQGAARPPILFTLGDVELLGRPSAAIVGRRSPTPNGLDLTERCSRHFVLHDAPIISGGARGVDTRAQESAAAAGGRVVVVLPEGLFHSRLTDESAEAVSDGRLLVVSEFLPSARWSTPNALMRNATIVGMARLVCVIEPGAGGGSAHAARTALKFGRPTLIHRHAEESIELGGHFKGAEPLCDATGNLKRDRIESLWARSPESTDAAHLF